MLSQGAVRDEAHKQPRKSVHHAACPLALPTHHECKRHTQAQVPGLRWSRPCWQHSHLHIPTHLGACDARDAQGPAGIKASLAAFPLAQSPATTSASDSQHPQVPGLQELRAGS